MVDAILGKLILLVVVYSVLIFTFIFDIKKIKRSNSHRFFFLSVMDTATREWDTLIMVEQAWVVVRVLQAGRFTSIQSSRTVLEFQRSQEQQQEQQQQQQQQHCQQDWIVRSVKNNGRDPDSPTTILAMFNPRAEEISHRGLDLKTGSMATVLTGASSTIT